VYTGACVIADEGEGKETGEGEGEVTTYNISML